MRLCTLALAALCHLATANLLQAQEPDGEKLVRQAWTAMKANDQKALGEFMAPGFQSAHEKGARDKAAQLELIKNLNLGEYQLSDFKATQAGDVIVVTYKVAVDETIDGKRLDKQPAVRLSVFVKIDGAWKWLAHSNLRRLQ